MDADERLLFRDTYRIPSTRLRDWDYGDAGMYFVTICTKHKIPWFGEIENHEMHLSYIGRIIDDEWKQTSIIQPYVTLDEYVIMPDHFHAIIMIRDHARVETFRRNVSTNTTQLQRPSPGSLGSIINQFKSVCTKRIRTIHPNFAWQPRFHDRVIRNRDETMRIRKYIINNPTAWTIKYRLSD